MLHYGTEGAEDHFGMVEEEGGTFVISWTLWMRYLHSADWTLIVSVHSCAPDVGLHLQTLCCRTAAIIPLAVCNNKEIHSRFSDY